MVLTNHWLRTTARNKVRSVTSRIKSVIAIPGEYRAFRGLRNDPGDRVVKDTETWNEHVAVVAAYPRISLAESTSRLLTSLQDLGATVILVANDSPDRDFCNGRWMAHADVVIHRANLGRDFGCYQRAMSHLQKNAPVGSIQRVSYFNDSVVYLPSSSTLIQNWLENASGTRALATTDASQPRAQTFAFSLDGTTAFSPSLRRFWSHLLLSNNRTTVIRRCEKRLSRILRSLSKPPLGYFSFERLDEAVQGDWGKLTAGEARGLRWAINFQPRIASSASISAADRESDSAEVRRRIAHEVPNWLGPNRAFGLVASRLLGFPVKVDIIASGAATRRDVSDYLDTSGIEIEEQNKLLDLMDAHHIG
jgi:hypothetical protein